MANGENVFHRKDGRFEARYEKERSADGKVVYGFCYGKTYEEAREKARLAKRELAERKEDGNTDTLAHFCDMWLRMNAPRLKPSSCTKYRRDMENHIKPSFGKRQPGGILPEEVEAFTRMLLEEKKLSPKTVRNILALFHTILLFIQKRMGEEPRILEISYPREPRKAVKVLDKKEENALLQTLASEMDLSKFGIYLALRTGMRIGEVCALRWCDISLEEEVINVCHTVQRLPFEPNEKEGETEAANRRTSLVLGTPKSDSSLRLIPLMPDIITLCIRFRPQSPEAFVLTGTDRCMDPRKLQRRLKKYLEECQIEEAHFHTLRHTFATRCVEVGFDVKTLSEILGHSNVGITLNQYVHPNLDLKRENMKRLKSVIML